MALSLAKAQLGAGRPLKVACVGHSMWPFLRDGQSLWVYPEEGARLGDLVLYEASGHLVLHRVVYAKGPLVTKGDAVMVPDGVLYKGEVLGIHRGGKRGLVLAVLSRHAAFFWSRGLIRLRMCYERARRRT